MQNPSTLRYGVRYPDGDFSGPITDSKSLANAYAGPFKAVVYDYEDPADPNTIAERQRFARQSATDGVM